MYDNFCVQGNQPVVIDSLEEEYSEDDEYTNQESNAPGQPIGRWRSTGKALEPKWRDGDSVPLVPFQTPTVANKSSNEKNQSSIEASNEDKDEDEKIDAKNRHSIHWKSQSQEKETIITDEYDFNKRHKPDHKNDYQGFRSPELRLSRRRKPTQLEEEEIYHPFEKAPSESQDFQDETNQGNKRENKVPKFSYDNNEYLEGVALRYRETFQNHPNEYELNDEEYQRPRPRKRRPPQNYEFAEVKTSPLSSNDKSTSSPTYSTTKTQRKQEATRRNNLIRTNHNRTTTKTSEAEKPTENSELKSLLKMQQVEGLSLSETLQRRNLTLSDLLQGKADVINLLKSTHVEDESEEELNAKAVEMMKISASSSIDISSTTDRVPWLPAKILEKQVDDPFANFRAASTHAYQKVLPTQKIKNERIHPTVSMNSAKMPVSSEIPIVVTTTDSMNIQEKERVKITYDEDEIMEFSDFTMKNLKSSTIANNSEKKETTQHTISQVDNFNRNSESTLSIEHILNPTKQPSFAEHESAINTFLEQSRERIQLENKIPHSGHEDEISSTEMDSIELEYQNDGPRDATIEVSQQKNEETPKEESSSKEEFTPNNSKTSDSLHHKTFLNHKNDQIYSQMEPDARAEILELFNGSSAKKLESLLKARNMSLEDLIALRQRGSSQLHLAEVAQTKDNSFKSPTAKDEQNEKLQNNKDVKIVKPDCSSSHGVKEYVEWSEEKETTKEPSKDILHIKEFETLPPNWSNQFGYPEIKQRSEEEEKEEINPEEFEERKTDFNPGTSNHSDDFISISNFDSSQPFENRQSPEEISFYTSEEPSSNLSEKRNNSVISIEDGRVQQIVNDISNTFNKIYRLNADEGKSEERDSTSRVRPSIIASGAILGVTIVVFLGIFIACRIRQKQKYTYRNTFSRAVFQSPVLTTRKLSNSSSLNTIMVNVVATSTTKRPEKPGSPETDDDYDFKSDIENDSLDANDSWETIPDFIK